MMTNFRPVDHTRPFLDIVREFAQQFKPYPEKLVKLFEEIDRAHFVPEELSDFLPDVSTNKGRAGLLSQPGVIFKMVALLFLKGHEVVCQVPHGSSRGLVPNPRGVETIGRLTTTHQPRVYRGWQETRGISLEYFETR